MGVVTAAVGGAFAGEGEWLRGKGAWLKGKGAWLEEKGAWLRGNGAGLKGKGAWLKEKGGVVSPSLFAAVSSRSWVGVPPPSHGGLWKAAVRTPPRRAAAPH